MNWPDTLGYFASSLVLVTFCMRTILPLRMVAVCSNVAFISYGSLAGITPILVLHLILLPLNAWRIIQASRLIRSAEIASRSSFSADWLLPYMVKSLHEKGSVIFRRGEIAEHLFMVVSGEVIVDELGLKLGTRDLFGEIGLFSPQKRRTQTAVCGTVVELASLSESALVDLCYSNPSVTFHLLRLTANRLTQNIAQMQDREIDRRPAPTLAC